MFTYNEMYKIMRKCSLLPADTLEMSKEILKRAYHKGLISLDLILNDYGLMLFFYDELKKLQSKNDCFASLYNEKNDNCKECTVNEACCCIQNLPSKTVINKKFLNQNYSKALSKLIAERKKKGYVSKNTWTKEVRYLDTEEISLYLESLGYSRIDNRITLLEMLRTFFNVK